MHGPGWRLFALGVAAVAVAWSSSPTAATAQTVVGIVMDADNGLPMAGVEVALLDSIGAAVRVGATDDAGRFVLDAPDRGAYRLRGRMLGYGELETSPLELAPGEVVQVELRLGVKPVELEGLRVVERRRGESMAERDMRQYRERLAEYRHYVGIRIFDRQALERVAGWSLADVLRLQPGRRCRPAIYWNGTEVKRPFQLDTLTPIESLEAVEFYSGFWAPNSLFADPRGCGVTLIWTRR